MHALTANRDAPTEVGPNMGLLKYAIPFAPHLPHACNLQSPMAHLSYCGKQIWEFRAIRGKLHETVHLHISFPLDNLPLPCLRALSSALGSICKERSPHRPAVCNLQSIPSVAQVLGNSCPTHSCRRKEIDRSGTRVIRAPRVQGMRVTKALSYSLGVSKSLQAQNQQKAGRHHE